MKLKDFLILQKEFCPSDPDEHELKLKKQLNFYVQAYFSLQEKLYRKALRG